MELEELLPFSQEPTSGLHLHTLFM